MRRYYVARERADQISRGIIMKRKINRVGQNTLTVSLPSKWVAMHHLKKGDELNISFDKDTLLISKSETAKISKEVTINVDDFTYMELSKHLTVYYKTGFNRITLIHSKTQMHHLKEDKHYHIKSLIKKVVSRFLGAEIVSQSLTKTEIECFIIPEETSLAKIERRIYYIFKEMIEELLNSIGPDYHAFHETTYDLHDNITKFINYYIRSVNESDKSEAEKEFAVIFYTVLDQMVDKFRHLSEKIDKYGCSDRLKKHIREVTDYFCEQVKAVNENKEIPYDLNKKRYAIKKRIDEEALTVKELKVLSEVYIFLETANAYMEYIIAKNMGEQISENCQ